MSTFSGRIFNDRPSRFAPHLRLIFPCFAPHIELLAESFAPHLRFNFSRFAPHDRLWQNPSETQLRSILHGFALDPAVGLSKLRPISARFCSSLRPICSLGRRGKYPGNVLRTQPFSLIGHIPGYYVLPALLTLRMYRETDQESVFEETNP